MNTYREGGCDEVAVAMMMMMTMCLILLLKVKPPKRARGQMLRGDRVLGEVKLSWRVNDSVHNAVLPDPTTLTPTYERPSCFLLA